MITTTGPKHLSGQFSVSIVTRSFTRIEKVLFLWYLSKVLGLGGVTLKVALHHNTNFDHHL